MNRFWKGFITSLLLLFITGCGGGGTTGNGSTVFISASVKAGAPQAIFYHMSSGLPTANSTSFTVTSTKYNTTGTVPASDVQINRVSYRFTPYSPAPAFTPSVTSFAWAGALTPGGTADLDNVPVLWPADYAAFGTACGSSLSYKYDATVTISGVEVNTGATLSTDVHISVFCM
jgi:hypothetical protein